MLSSKKAPQQRGVCVKHLNRCKTSTCRCWFLPVMFRFCALGSSIFSLQSPDNEGCTCRGTQHFTGTESNEATSEMGYPAWPAGRTCVSFISSSWEVANPRTTLPICFFKLCQTKLKRSGSIPCQFTACTVFAIC